MDVAARGHEAGTIDCRERHDSTSELGQI
jgi:hypothetical protein